ncbi:MAG TPA: hypothetical protein VLJ17_20465 [Xanthobacteraceae bacterium]|nr:hypothetical protein [Xanthobacteraceae bacterium]
MGLIGPSKTERAPPPISADPFYYNRRFLLAELAARYAMDFPLSIRGATMLSRAAS